MAPLIFENLAIYWKTLFIIIYPLVTLPIFILNNKPEMRCLYVTVLMAGYWVFEVIPLAITSLIPLVLLPMMGILDTKTTSLQYFKEANMMFIGGLIVALAVEYCNLHTRVSLICIKLIGCSYRRLNFGLVTLTMLVSMWISNTAATAMMIPIIEAILAELQSEGLGKVWENEEELGEDPDPDLLRPSRVSMCFYISTAYAASIGGLGCIVGSGTNLVLKGHYEDINFTDWLAANIPLMLAIMYPSWIWLQFWFMGLFRPNSKDAKAINVGKEGEEVARRVVVEKLDSLGPFTFHEIMVGLLFILVVCLWFFRSPGFIKGWAAYLTDTPVGDSTPAMIVVMLLFMLPARYDFIYMFSKDEEKRPKKPAGSLITWRFINQKMHWGLLFLLGGGFALAEGIKKSGMGKMVAGQLEALSSLDPLAVMAISCLLAMVVTQFTSNAAIANILLPIIHHLAESIDKHPLYLMMPVCLACSFSYCLPVSTPPNAIAAAPCNMRSAEMIKAASVIQVIAFVMLIAIFPHLGQFIWNFNDLSDYANITTTTIRPTTTTPTTTGSP